MPGEHTLSLIVSKVGVAALAVMAQGEDWWLSDGGKDGLLSRSCFERMVRQEEIRWLIGLMRTPT